jgi:hypothetical protein
MPTYGTTILIIIMRMAKGKPSVTSLVYIMENGNPIF